MRRYDILPLTGKGESVLYRLVFTIKAFADFEELAGVSLFDIPWEELKEETIVTLMWVALLDQHPSATRVIAMALIEQHKTHGTLKLLNAIKRAQGEPKKADESKEAPPIKAFWANVAEMAAALNLKPWEAERYTFSELSVMAAAKKKENEAHLERVAWQTALLLSPHSKKPITADDLLGRSPSSKPIPKDELLAQFDDIRRKRGIAC